ncbi:MAG: DUF6474 family protein [Pseudonocardia sp.]
MGLRRRAGSSMPAGDPGAGGPGALGAGFAAAEIAGAARDGSSARGGAAPGGGRDRTAGAGRRDGTGRNGRRDRRPLTAGRAKRLIGVGTAVAPLLAPYALAAAGAARARWDAHRAARMGVTPDQLSAFAGRGGALHARLSRVAETLGALDGGPSEQRRNNERRNNQRRNNERRNNERRNDGGHNGDRDDALRFAAAVRPRLADLAMAVRAAEQLPAPRRRAAFRAIGGELDRVEAELLGHLGIDT